MRSAVETMSTAIANGENGVPHDLAFHRAIAEATGNPHFLKLFNYLGELLLPRTRLRTADLSGTSAQDYLDRINGEHRQVLAAIERGDSEAARAAMRLHLMGSKQRLEASSPHAAAARSRAPDPASRLFFAENPEPDHVVAKHNPVTEGVVGFEEVREWHVPSGAAKNSIGAIALEAGIRPVPHIAGHVV